MPPAEAEIVIGHIETLQSENTKLRIEIENLHGQFTPILQQNARLLEALKMCLPYVEDLEGENFDDESVGIFSDKGLTKALETARTAIAEAEETVQPRTTAVEPPAQRLFKATKEITSYLRKQYPWSLSEPFKSLLIEAENALDDPHGYEPKGIVAPVKQPEK